MFCCKHHMLTYAKALLDALTLSCYTHDAGHTDCFTGSLALYTMLQRSRPVSCHCNGLPSPLCTCLSYTVLYTCHMLCAPLTCAPSPRQKQHATDCLKAVPATLPQPLGILAEESLY